MSRNILSQLAFLLFLLSTLPSKYQAAIIGPPQPLSLLNNASYISASNMSTLSGGRASPVADRYRYCGMPKPWQTPDFYAQDCLGARDWLYLEELALMKKGARPCEFRSPGSPKRTHAAVQWTPRTYTFRTCTVAISMVNYISDKPGELPGGDKIGLLTDSSTWSRLYDIVEALVNDCILEKGEMGWQMAGNKLGIGVFVWATNSERDIDIEAIDIT